MKSSTITAGLVAAAFLSATSVALGQAKPQARVDFGELEYKSSCAACHGPKAKGDGPYMKWLVKPAPDLTTLAKANKGVFPLQRVYDIIDGRGTTDIGLHGSREMPVWGARYSTEATGYYYYAEVPGPFDPEALVRARILALAEYLNRVQVK